jgi:hypothetical protein
LRGLLEHNPIGMVQPCLNSPLTNVGPADSLGL